MAVLAVLGVLAMPVDYRAGLALVHPHSTVQLLGDISSGTPHHHPTAGGYRGHSHGHRPGATRGSHTTPVSAVPPRPLQATTLAVTPTPAAIVAAANLLQPGDDPAIDDDQPVVIARLAGGKISANSVLLPAPPVLSYRWRAHDAGWPSASIGTEHIPEPEPPPPRPGSGSVLL